jgi:hypothetical protein
MVLPPQFYRLAVRSSTVSTTPQLLAIRGFNVNLYGSHRVRHPDNAQTIADSKPPARTS